MQSKLLRQSIFLLSCFFVSNMAFAQFFDNVGIRGTIHMLGGLDGQPNYAFRVNNGSDDGERFRITESGKVSIGIPYNNWIGDYNIWDPSYKFFVNGKSYLTNGLQFSNAFMPKITFFKSTPSATYTSGIGTTGDATTGQVKLNYTITDVVGSAHAFYKGGDNGNGTELMRIQADGKVGIGMGITPIHPIAKLHVSGGQVLVDNNGVLTGMGPISIPTPGNATYMGWVGTGNAKTFTVGANNQATMFFTTNGNVGVGTNPSKKLHVNGDFRVETDYSMGGAGTFKIDAPSIVGGRLTVDANGNVGIGINSPLYKLHVRDGAMYVDHNGTQFGISVNPGGIGWIGTETSKDIVIAPNNVPALRATAAGKVGIGNNSPFAKLTIDGDLGFGPSTGITPIGNKITLWTDRTLNPLTYGFGIAGGKLAYRVANNAAAHVFYAGGTNADGTELMRIKGDGTTTFTCGTDDGDEAIQFAVQKDNDAAYIGTSSNHKLSIGTGGFESIVLKGHDTFIGFLNENLPDISTAASNNYDIFVNKGVLSADFALAPVAEWADYVFGKNYKLKPLNEVEQFIKANEHLPGIPSAAEVQKDGYSIKNINVKFLEKIEELTLYTIEQEKEINALKKQMQQYEQLADEVEKLKQAINQK